MLADVYTTRLFLAPGVGWKCHRARRRRPRPARRVPRHPSAASVSGVFTGPGPDHREIGGLAVLVELVAEVDADVAGAVLFLRRIGGLGKRRGADRRPVLVDATFADDTHAIGCGRRRQRPRREIRIAEMHRRELAMIASLVSHPRRVGIRKPSKPIRATQVPFSLGAVQSSPRPSATPFTPTCSRRRVLVAPCSSMWSPLVISTRSPVGQQRRASNSCVIAPRAASRGGQAAAVEVDREHVAHQRHAPAGAVVARQAEDRHRRAEARQVARGAAGFGQRQDRAHLDVFGQEHAGHRDRLVGALQVARRRLEIGVVVELASRRRGRCAPSPRPP